jgi:hypothetical protein
MSNTLQIEVFRQHLCIPTEKIAHAMSCRKGLTRRC